MRTVKNIGHRKLGRTQNVVPDSQRCENVGSILLHPAVTRKEVQM